MNGLKLYSDENAVNFEVLQRENKTLCLAVQFAKKIDGTNTFDWKNGVMFNLLDKELMEVTALFLGYNREFTLKNNGKFLDFACQSKCTPRVYLKAGSGKLFFNLG